SGRDHARNDRRQPREIPPVERKLRNRLAVHDVAERRGLRLRLDRLSDDLYRFRYVADLEREIDLDPVLYVEPDRGPALLLEARKLGRDLIGPDPEQRGGIVARGISHGGERYVGLHVADRDRHPWNDAAAAIGYGPDDRARVTLSEQP